MNFLDILLLGFALSMDAAAVSISDGMSFKIRNRTVILIAGTFGFFQFLMPVLGYLGTSLFYEQIKALDHWIAFLLLLFLGAKMIFESICKKDESKTDSTHSSLRIKELALQGIATSIDALAVGISFAALKDSLKLGLLPSALIIGFTTFFLCIPAVLAGKKSAKMLGKHAEILGGIILIGIGLKIFIQHQFFGG